MVEVEKYCASDKQDLQKRERYWVEELSVTLNARIPSRTSKDYYNDNKEYLIKKQKEHREKNREKISQRQKEYREKNREKIVQQDKRRYEKNKESILPFGFWLLSLIGSIMILFYALIRKDPVLLVGHLMGSIIYFRNIILSKRYS